MRIKCLKVIQIKKMIVFILITSKFQKLHTFLLNKNKIVINKYIHHVCTLHIIWYQTIRA